MQGYEAHVFRTFQLSVSVVVPLAQLQSILPAGFIALANPAGSDTAQVGMSLIFYQRSERAATEADGPASVLAVTALVRNSLLSRNETVLLANEQNNPTKLRQQAIVRSLRGHYEQAFACCMSAHRIARGPRSAAGEDAGRKGVGFERRSRLLIGQLAPF
jgi:hypothetical protein